jgi:phospholipase/carboxylesterase
MLEHPELVDAAILLHPLIPWDPSPVPGLANRRILITAGERDPICPPEQTRALETYLRAQNAQVSTVWHPGGHEIRSEELQAAQAFLAGAPA